MKTTADDLTTLTALRRAAGVEPDDLTAGGVRTARALTRMRAASVLRRMGLEDGECALLIRACEAARIDPLALGTPGVVRTLAISQLRLFAAREEAGAEQWLPEPTHADYDEPPDTYGIEALRRARHNKG